MALDVIFMIEERGRAKEFVEKFKLALVGADPLFWSNKLYPEFFSQEGEGTEDAIIQPGVEYKMPEMTEEERQELLDELIRQNPKAMSFGEYQGEVESEWQ